MAASGDVKLAQDGGQGNVKLHPYLVTLVRWCVSCLWSTATVLLHRLMTTPLQPITGPKPPLPPKPKIPKRVAGTEHLHPEPRVECQLLHLPANHTLDVIFVHGLYGSLGNTWRQGDWHLKYKADPQKVPLRKHSTPNPCNCHENPFNNHIYNENKCDAHVTDINDPDMSSKKINAKLSKKVIPKENDLITEQFYNNTLLDQVEIVDNYDTQAKFVRDLFKKENNCDINCDEPKCDDREQDGANNEFKCVYNESDNDFKCKFNLVSEFNECKCVSGDKKCGVGCGCVCNDCYSTCWPRDWIKADFPGARVISINYTSDPYLWRPLWIKENKRLNLYQRAEQMIEQLLEMGVGDRPIIWVGHSKGGLFIKQIYCEAYEAYTKTNKNTTTTDQPPGTSAKRTEKTPNNKHNGITAANIDTIIGHFTHDKEQTKKPLTNDNCTGNNDNYNGENDNYTGKNDNYIGEDDNYTGEDDNYTDRNDNYTGNNDNYKGKNDNYTGEDNYTGRNDNYTGNNDNYTGENDNYTGENDNYTREDDNYTGENENYNGETDNYTKNDNYTRTNNNYQKNNIGNNNTCVMNEIEQYKNVFEQTNIAKNESASNHSLEYVRILNDNECNLINENGPKGYEKEMDIDNGNEDVVSSFQEAPSVSKRAALWSSSRGFMFYSVPHRGSPLADIKTPVTARSVDLLEIAKDCPLVLELHSRWLLAAYSGGAARVSVRSFVETCRTLMSVLWLRIVSTDSADAGIGVLSGVSVDHREICKPTSRTCLLYTELTDLIQDALKCKCH